MGSNKQSQFSLHTDQPVPGAPIRVKASIVPCIPSLVSQSGQLNIGDPVYIGNDGIVTGSVADFTDGDFVRVIGYVLGITGGVLWFNPDSTFVQVNA